MGKLARKNLEILNTIDKISEIIGKKGIRTLDRGGDRRKLFVPILQREIQFVVRMTTQRDMIDTKGKRRNIANIAKDTKWPNKH